MQTRAVFGCILLCCILPPLVAAACGSPPRPAAGPARQFARVSALTLTMDLAMSHGDEPQRWASAEGTMLAVGPSALSYCLKHLSRWLSRGGMALGAPAPCPLAMCCLGLMPPHPSSACGLACMSALLVAGCAVGA